MYSLEKNDRTERRFGVNWRMTLVLCCFLGMTGIHHFYTGRFTMGLGMLIFTSTGLFLFFGLDSPIGLFFLLASAIWNLLDFFFILFSGLERKF